MGKMFKAVATKMQAALRDEIASRQAEIDQFQSALDLLSGTFGGTTRSAKTTRVRSVAKTKASGLRVDWDAVLKQVPNRFGVEQIMKIKSAASKGRAQVYPALNRWESTGRIKRVEKGVYVKVGAKAKKKPAVAAAA